MKLGSKTKLALFMLSSFIFGVVSGRTLPQWEDLVQAPYWIAYWAFFVIMIIITWFMMKKYEVNEVE